MAILNGGKKNYCPHQANKLSKGHIEFQRQKMNVKVAAQTLSSSVADAIEYLMNSDHPNFANAGGTLYISVFVCTPSTYQHLFMVRIVARRQE